MPVVFGYIKRGNDSGFRKVVTFKPVATPLADDPDILVSGEIRVNTDDNGYFSTTLRKGDYEAIIFKDKFKLVVPRLGGPYNWLDLISSEFSWDGKAVPGAVASAEAAAQAAASAALAAISANAAFAVDKTTTEMRAITKSLNNRLCLKKAEADSPVGIYSYSMTTTDSDDGISVIRTTGESSGGWIKRM